MNKEKCCCCDKEINKMNKETIKPIKVRFCPKCKSTDVGFVFRLQTLFGLLPKVECRKCGYQNIDFPILVVNKKDLEKKNKKIERVKKKKTIKKINKKGSLKR